MRMVDLIQKKKLGLALSPDEIDFIVNGYTSGQIPDYQMSALLMAIYFQGMNQEETADLTLALVNSGERIDLSGIEGIKVDKHSTGGVGDKVSLIIIPWSPPPVYRWLKCPERAWATQEAPSINWKPSKDSEQTFPGPSLFIMSTHIKWQLQDRAQI